MMLRHSAHFFALLLIGVIVRDVNARDYSARRPNNTSVRDITQTNDFVVLSKMSNEDGERICRNYGDGLALVKTSEQRQKLLDFINTLDRDEGDHGFTYYWVGASDIGKSSGDFYWRDGSKVDNTLWGQGDPNDFQEGQKTCVNIDYPDGHLHDYKCSEALLYRPVCHLSYN